MVASWLLGGCASVSGRHERDVELMQDSIVVVGQETPISKKKGEIFSLSLDKPLLIQSPGHVSLMILPASEQVSQKIRVALKPITEWNSEAQQSKNDRVLSELVLGVNSAQLLLSTQHSKEALAKIEELRGKYPKITSLKFLEASCLFVLGERVKAKVLLEGALQEFPDNKEGQELYQILAGNSSRGKSQ